MNGMFLQKIIMLKYCFVIDIFVQGFVFFITWNGGTLKMAQWK